MAKYCVNCKQNVEPQKNDEGEMCPICHGKKLNPERKKMHPLLVIVIILATIVGLMIMFRTANSGNKIVKNEEVQKEISDIKFFTIRTNMEKMTEAQFKEYKKTIEGSRIKWTGWIEEVEEKNSDNYKLYVDMDSPDTLLSIQDVYIDNIPKDIALKLQKDNRVTFIGDISSVHNILSACQVSLENVELINK
jgi:DNA-directed RNA polymerase subunit RPC12/RpoP